MSVHGYTGQIAVVNLTEREVEVQSPDSLFYRKYVGGKGFCAYYLLKYVEPETDALDPQNTLVFAISPITGAPVPGISRFSVAAKSPLTGGYGEAEAGGDWGARLKFAGFDALVIRGKADTPVYLLVQDGKVEICDAGDLWGKSTEETVDAMEERLGDKTVSVVSIGPGGEKQIRYACIIEGTQHAAGRTGTGAVMGSKNLKAIVTEGRPQIDLADRERVHEVTRWMSSQYMDNPLSRALYEYGTLASVGALQATGMLPSRNFQEGRFPDWEKISAEFFNANYLAGREGCYACPIRCKRQVKSKLNDIEVNAIYGGPEYETVAAFGSNLGIDDMATICKLHEICNANSIDTISAGVAIAFAMECFEAGLISEAETNGVQATFGSTDAVLALLHQIVRREGIGELLGEGVKRAAEVIGPESESFAMHVRGQEIPMHEPRGKFGVGLGYAVAETGADHMVAAHDTMFVDSEAASFKAISPFGLLETVAPTSLDHEKVRQYLYLEQWWNALKAFSVCFFAIAPRGLMPVNMFVDLIRGVTGWDTSLWEVMKAGERSHNLARTFNVLHCPDQDESLPARFDEAFATGPLSGVNLPSEDMARAVELHHQMAGWSSDGTPQYAKLCELDLAWVAKELEDAGISTGAPMSQGED